MARFQAKVTTGGRITIPETTRKTAGIEDGDIVDVKIVGVTSDG